MALTLSKTGIAQDQTINAWHVTQSIDAFAGTVAYDITISGSLDITNSTNTGDLTGTASWASTAVLANNATTASKANNVLISNAGTTNKLYRVTFVDPLNVPAIGSNFYDSLTVDSGSDGSGMYYNPSTNTLTTTNFAGTASQATSASFAATYTTPTYLSGTMYPSGSAQVPGTSLKFIAGASQTDGTSTAAVTVNELIGKSLNQNCFITAMAEDASPGAISIDPSSPPPNLSFKSQNPNTKFHFHILYV